MIIGEGADGDFEVGFEGGAVVADMEFDRFDGGHTYSIKSKTKKPKTKIEVTKPLIHLR